jgi:defect-in-organelle-trafficking protein DotD
MKGNRMKCLLLLPILGCLVGCAGSTANSGGVAGMPAIPNQAQLNQQVTGQLQQAADSAQTSLQELAAIEKLQQNNITIPLSNVDDPALNENIAIKWYGPIEPLLSQVAASTGYQLQVFGKPPSLPVLINIDTTSQPTTAINIIRNADLQAGLKVVILVLQDQKIISLRYS